MRDAARAMERVWEKCQERSRLNFNTGGAATHLFALDQYEPFLRPRATGEVLHTKVCVCACMLHTWTHACIQGSMLQWVWFRAGLSVKKRTGQTVKCRETEEEAAHLALHGDSEVTSAATHV